jgi:FtsP/CotA-like multicopper oxidase with cupredoxin domain
MKKRTWIGAISALLLAGAAIGSYAWLKGEDAETESAAVSSLQPEVKQDANGPYKQFTIDATEQTVELKKGLTFSAWTFNGTVPGSQIRVKEGDRLKVVLNNHLPEPVAIHWHGYPVPNSMDGIPGVTQNAVMPHQSFTYEFTATVPGTYWYHSHQNSSEQEDKGLYGTLVVEPKQSTNYNRDYTLVLDEWNPDMFKAGASGGDHSGHDMSNMQGMDHSKNAGMDHSQHAASGYSHDAMMKQMYSVFTVNGKTGDSIEPLQVKKGDRVKLRFINAGFLTHTLHLQSQTFRITDADGQPLLNAPDVQNKLLAIAPGERYDVEFTSDGDNWSIDLHDDLDAANEVKIPVQADGKSERVDREQGAKQVKLGVLDIATYSAAKPLPPAARYDVEQKLVLGSKTIQKDGREEEVYTINDKIAPDIDPIHVEKGQTVKLTLTNPGTLDHPMHLHGHFFQVLSKNGRPVSGSLLKDTINVRPGETYEIAFRADNTGNWMIHCHDLHHSAAGMMTHLIYEDWTPFKADPNVPNQPE